MSRTARDNILEQDKRWMVWLKATSKRKGSSGETLLAEYAANKDAWYASVEQLRAEKMEDWQFCRGQLSDVEMASARDRYLSQYVFVAGDNCSRSFVDALLEIEDAQIRQRLDPSAPVKCSHCAENEQKVRRLLSALSARKITTNDDIQLACVVSAFQRQYMLGEGYSTPRRVVRMAVEALLREEISPLERLSSNGTLWYRFLRETLGEEVHIHNDLPCRPRIPPISREEFAAEMPGSAAE
jgi:hypothetical protein